MTNVVLTKALLAAVLVVLLGLSGTASAAMIQIQLGGIDIRYDGTNIVDTGSENPDPLTNATFLVDNAPVGVDNTGVTLDVFIPGVFNIPITGGQVTSATNGRLDLDLGETEFLSLTLDLASVTYISLTSTIQFVFAGAAATIDDQQLPYGLSLADPVTISFSTQITGPVGESVDHYVTNFVAAGTGEIQAIPEPATMGLLGLGAVALIRRRRQ